MDKKILRGKKRKRIKIFHPMLRSFSKQISKLDNFKINLKNVQLQLTLITTKNYIYYIELYFQYYNSFLC